MIELELTSESGGKEPTINKRTWRIWWDDNHQRVDYIPGPPEPANRIVQCANCERDGWGVRYDEEQNVLATLKPISEFRKEGGFHHIRDPRTFGHNFNGLFLSGKGIQAKFPPNPPTDIVVVAGPGGDLWQLTWQRGGADDTFTITADPNRGYEVTAMESKGKGYRESLRTVPKQWGEGVVSGADHLRAVVRGQAN